jgi:hypothetical protein
VGLFMKLVFTADEVAAVLQMPRPEFERLRPGLEAAGFPPPIAGLTDRWSIINVINWVNSDGRPTTPPQPSYATNNTLLS